jgi:hypothetical protein
MIRFVLTILTLCGPWCRAAIVPQLALDQLVAGSECIIQGSVLRSWPAWDQRRQFIWTHIEVLVRERWKESGSTADRTVVLSEPGGTVGAQTMQVGGTAAYQVGEELVVFVYRTPIGYLRAIGNGQGKFTITQRPGSPQKYMHSDAAGLELIPESAGRRAVRMTGMDLEEFRRTVQSLIARKAAH